MSTNWYAVCTTYFQLKKNFIWTGIPAEFWFCLVAYFTGKFAKYRKSPDITDFLWSFYLAIVLSISAISFYVGLFLPLSTVWTQLHDGLFSHMEKTVPAFCSTSLLYCIFHLVCPPHLKKGGFLWFIEYHTFFSPGKLIKKSELVLAWVW